MPAGELVESMKSYFLSRLMVGLKCYRVSELGSQVKTGY